MANNPTKMDKLMSDKMMSKEDLAKLSKLEKDPVMSQLLNKLIESRIETAIKESKEKKICPCSVVVGKKKAMEILESESEEDKVELFISSVEDKDQIFTQCTRPTYEKEKYCWKHCQVYTSKPDNIVMFEKIKQDVKSREAKLEDEIFTITSSKQSKETLNFIRSQNLINIFAKAIGHEGEVNINIKKSASIKDTDDDDNEVADADEAEEEAADDASDEVQCKEISTSDGRKLYLDEATGQIYSPEGDDQGKELGVLMTVDDKTSLEIDGEHKIVAKEHKYNKKDYFRCALSDKLYQSVEDKLSLVGKVTAQKNGEYKVTLTPATTKAPAATKAEPAPKKAEPAAKKAPAKAAAKK